MSVGINSNFYSAMPCSFTYCMVLVSDNPQSAIVTTLDEVKLFQLKTEDLQELIEEHPVLFQEIEDKISTYS